MYVCLAAMLLSARRNKLCFLQDPQVLRDADQEFALAVFLSESLWPRCVVGRGTRSSSARGRHRMDREEQSLRRVRMDIQ